MEFTASMIAGFLKGEVEGNPEVKVNTVAKIEEGFAGALSFLANPKYEPYIYTTKSSVVLVNKTFSPEAPIAATLIKVDDAYKSFAILLQIVQQQMYPKKQGIHTTAVIEKNVQLGKDVYIGAYAYIGENSVIGDGVSIYPQAFVDDNVKIGANSTIYAGVKIYHDCVIGEGCTIHAGTVIGADGFGFAPQSADEFMKIPQLGNVVLENHVEIGANTTIDRATMGSTIIHKGVKVDNLIQVGHNVEIGENTVMAAQTGISGSTKIGKNCMIGGQVGFAGHLKIANGTKFGAQSGIISDIKEENKTFMGSPILDHKQNLRSQVIFRKLPELYQKVYQLEKEIQELKKE